MSTVALPQRVDFSDPALIADPYPVYSVLRAKGPLCRCGVGRWGVTRYVEVAAMLRDKRLGNALPDDFRQMSAGTDRLSAFFKNICLMKDPPEHARLRQLLGKAFGTSVGVSLRHHVDSVVKELVEPLTEKGRFDVVADVAKPLPTRVV